MKIYALIIPLIFFISACDSGPTLSNICQDHPELCQEFTEDSWCKAERKNTIISSYQLQQTNNDKNKYTLLLDYEAYAKCVSFSTQIEHIKLKEKRTARINNHEKVKQRIHQLSQETKDSKHPNLLYYHWSRYLDEDAIKHLLTMEGSGALETPTLQFNLATYYTKIDRKKTLALLYHALELYQPDAVLNTEIFQSLFTIYNHEKKYKQAYIWLKVWRLYDPENEVITEENLLEFSEKHQIDAAFLNKVASKTLNNIESAKFEAPKF